MENEAIDKLINASFSEALIYLRRKIQIFSISVNGCFKGLDGIIVSITYKLSVAKTATTEWYLRWGSSSKKVLKSLFYDFGSISLFYLY